MHIGSSVNGKFTVVSRLGSGSFSTVYQGREELTLKPVALKTLHPDVPSLYLTNELEAMQTCQVVSGVPRIYNSGYVGDTPYMVMELLGPDLFSMVCKQGKFPPPLVVQIAIQSLRTLQGIHSFGYLHLDIKPDNILIKCRKDSFQCFIIDFGLAKRYSIGGRHYPASDRKEFRGNSVFASRRMLKRKTPSRRDDLESLIYTWAFLANGSLPWTLGEQALLKGPRERLAQAKKTISPATICGLLPPEFEEMLNDVRGLEFTETPHYACYEKWLDSASGSWQVESLGHWNDLLSCQRIGSFTHFSKSEDISPLMNRRSIPITSQTRKATIMRFTKKIRIVRSTKRHLVVIVKLNNRRMNEAEAKKEEEIDKTFNRQLTDKKEVAVTPQFRTRLQALRHAKETVG